MNSTLMAPVLFGGMFAFYAGLIIWMEIYYRGIKRGADDVFASVMPGMASQKKMMAKMAIVISEAEKRFEAIDSETNDAAEIACREILIEYRDEFCW